MVIYYNLLYNIKRIDARGGKMKLLKKLNNRGFMLVETLITTVFIMVIFSLIYTNLMPFVGEYERMENYDTVESVYVAHWARKLVLDGLPDSYFNTVKTNGYVKLDANSFNADIRDLVNGYLIANGVEQIYLTTYNTEKFKNYVSNSDSFERDFEEYIAYLPSYKNNAAKQNYYRVIVEYHGYLDNDVNSYGTIEVIR